MTLLKEAKKMKKSEVDCLNRKETIHHLNISGDSLQRLIKDGLVLAFDSDNFPMFQFNGEALDIRILTIAKILRRNGSSVDQIVSWFNTYNEVIEDIPVSFIKRNGINSNVTAAASLSSDIFVL